jgi:hypothetical protein
MSSALAPYSIARTASPIISPAFAPTMCTPSTRSVSASAMILTEPSVSAFVFARLFAEKGKRPTLYLTLRAGARQQRARDGMNRGRAPGGLELLLGLADPRDLGVRVHDAWDDVVVDVAVAGLDVLDGGDALLLGLVGEHGPEGDVADALDVRRARAERGVDDDAALAVELDAGLVEVQTLGHGAAADGDEHDVGHELALRVSGCAESAGT